MYTLRFPFELPSGQAISGECRIELGDLVILITQEGKRYLVTVEGLESEQAAQGYVAKLWAALMWVLLNKKLAVQADTHLQQISWRPANSHEFMGIPIDDDIDGAIDDSRPGVYPSGKRFLKMGINPATVMITTSASHVGQILLEGLSFPKSGNVLANSKLKGEHYPILMAQVSPGYPWPAACKSGRPSRKSRCTWHTVMPASHWPALRTTTPRSASAVHG